MDEIELRGDPPVAYLRSAGLPVWLVVRMLRDSGSADEFVRSSQIEHADIAAALDYFDAHHDEIEAAIAEEQAWAYEVQKGLEASAAAWRNAPSDAGRYSVRVRRADGSEREIGTLFSATRRDVGDIIDLPEQSDETPGAAPLQKWRVVAVEPHDDQRFAGTLVVEPAQTAQQED